MSSITLPKRGKNYSNNLESFADQILTISEQIGFKVSSRGWCYLLEGDNLIDKSKFDLIQKLINKWI